MIMNIDKSAITLADNDESGYSINSHKRRCKLLRGILISFGFS